MSSRVLYPCIIDSYMPAFVATTECSIYFSLSKFNGSGDFQNVHVSIMDQATGRNVLKTSNKNSTTGILINIPFEAVENQDNLFVIKIPGSALEQGWIADRIYKVQLRLSNATWLESEDQAKWLHDNANYFSEWSTVCVLKAISPINYALPILEIDTSITNQGDIIQEINTYYSSTLALAGSFIRAEDSTELVNFYSFTLYDEDNNILETSGDIYTNKYTNTDSFTYVFKTELENEKNYSLAFKFTTINGYEGGFYYFDELEDDRYNFVCSLYSLGEPPCSLLSVENDRRAAVDTPLPEDSTHHHTDYAVGSDVVKDLDDSPGWPDGEPVTEYTKLGPWIMKDIVGTSTYQEEEEGRIILKFASETTGVYSGNLCIRRSDSRDNFKTWTDVFIYVAKSIDIDSIPLFYDYTIESGVWYKYGVQEIKSNGDRGTLRVINNPIIRNFNYSFLLGQNNQQLKLEFDNTMSNFKYQIYDSKSDPIGSKFAHIARNAETYYRTFPLNGLISFNMDEAELFCNKKIIYNYENVIELYEKYNEDNNITQNDFIYEREFRNKVLEFLQNGEVKLFKSPTEGNIIVRLTEVSCVPNQTLDRMIYSFSATASEMNEPTMANYKSYGFYNVADYESSFAIYETKLGQITGDIAVGADIFKLIQTKYGDGEKNIAGYTKKAARVHHIKITFNDKPLKINNGSEVVLGNKFSIKGANITVLNPQRVYEFDNRLIYDTDTDSFILYGDDGEIPSPKISTIDVTIDFLYELETDVYVPKEIQSRSVKQGIGQIYKNCTPNENLFNEIYYKYYLDWDDQFLRLNQLSAIIIESNPNAAFAIRDVSDAEAEVHIIGITGILELFNIENIIEIKYLGIKNPITGEIESKNTDVMLNYIYIVTKGAYKTVANG